MAKRHGPNSTCPGYLEEQFIDGGSGRVTCPWCAVELVRDGGGNVVHKGKRKPWSRCTGAALSARSDVRSGPIEANRTTGGSDD